MDMVKIISIILLFCPTIACANSIKIPPERALLIHSKGGGKLGIIEQNILDDVTKKVLENDNKLVIIEGSLEKIDTIDKKELYLE